MERQSKVSALHRARTQESGRFFCFSERNLRLLLRCPHL